MFSKSCYKNLLTLISESGYCLNNELSTLRSGDCFLRHDIDFSIDLALEIAIYENENSIKSSYFFMLSSNMYNLLSYDSVKKVKKIKELGHTISLHFDPDCYDDFLEGFKTEKLVFESVFGVKLKAVSIHRPGKFLDDNDVQLPDVIHTYESKFFKEIEYISDSAGSNPYNKVKSFLEKASHKPLQLLIHPVWWCEKSNSVTSTLNKWFEERNHFIRKEIALNCRTYKG